jgi:hypothetical protein
MAIYLDPDTGKAVTSQSMIKTFRRCPKLAEFKYVRRLSPRIKSKPLTRGTWFHKLLEEHYAGRDWKKAHKRMSLKFNELFDEEKDELGDLPREMLMLMRSYLWHYEQEEIKVLGVEQKVEVEFPDGTIFRLKYDMLVEDEFGIWAWDHKTHKRLPNFANRLLDVQSAVYVWALRRAGIPVEGFVWNYVRTEGLKPLEPLKDGSRISRWASCDTDYPTAVRAIKKHGLPIYPHREKLKYLRSLQYRHGEPQRSSYFQRHTLERDDDMLRRVATEAYHTSRRMHSYFPQKNPDAVERISDRACGWCEFRDPCATQLMGGNIEFILRQRFREVDPMERYQDEKEFDDAI